MATASHRIPLWRGDHVSIRQLTEDFARYAGLELLTWERESFAFADSYDENTGRYRGLCYGKGVMLPDASSGLLVKPEAARRQIDADAAEADRAGRTPGQAPSSNGRTNPDESTTPGPTPSPPLATQPKRFHGTVSLDPTRVGRDAGRIADEVVSHLSGLVGAKIAVILEIEAEIPTGAPDNVVRTVTENSRTLRFSSQGFEME